MRTKNSIKNIITGISSQVMINFLSFFSRTIFIHTLGANYLGLNGLFTNILSMLSLAELGVGSAIIYNLYKPLADNNTEKIKSLMRLYAKAYKIIGIFIGISGMILLPFIDLFINDTPNVSNIEYIYILFLLNSVISYFYSYKSSLIIADQKNYIIVLKRQKITFIQTIVQIIILLITKNYILYLYTQIIFNFIFNFTVSRHADRLYPYLQDKCYQDIDNKSKKDIYRHVIAMMSHKVGGIIVDGTDNLLISSFVGVFWVGIYSNYTMILGILNSFIGQVFTALTASVGNLNAEDNIEKSYRIYEKIFFINAWIYGFCTICLIILFNPFIQLWLGEEYLLSKNIVYIIAINFYIKGMRQTNIMFNTTLGLFWKDRFKPWIESTVNLSLSIILLKYFGFVGVLLGTLISTVSTSLWIEPWILFRYGFQKDFKIYWKYYTKYTVMIIFILIITLSFNIDISENILINFISKGIVCLVIPNSIFIILNLKNIKATYPKRMLSKNEI